MKHGYRTLIAWICLSVIMLNGMGGLLAAGRTIWAGIQPPQAGVEVADFHGVACHEEQVASVPTCPHCTAACEEGKGHVCGMGHSAPASGGLVFGIPSCQGVPPGSDDYVPTSIGFVFLPPPVGPVMLLASARLPILNPDFILSDFSSTPPSPPPEFIAA